MTKSRIAASELPCLFEVFAIKYPESLPSCGTKENQTCRFTSRNAAVEKIKIMAKYFSELSLLLDSLESYSLCEKHYNQVVAKDLLLKNLKKAGILEETEENNQRKRLRHDEIQAQVTSPDPEIARLTRELLDAQTNLEESHTYYVDVINKYEQTIERLKDENARLLSENEELKEKLNTIFDDQQSRIDLITKIAQKEHKDLYNDITNLMSDHGRFQLDSLLEYSTFQWLEKRNPVIVKFIGKMFI